MAKFTGKTVIVNASAQEICDKFSDLSTLNSVVDKLPDSERQKIGELSFQQDAISIVNPQIGNLTFRVVERSENLIKMSASQPLAMSLNVNMAPTDSAASTELTTVIDINIPVFLKGMLAPHLQKAADQFGTLMAKIAEGNGI
jgi:hypothetical protein